MNGILSLLRRVALMLGVATTLTMLAALVGASGAASAGTIRVSVDTSGFGAATGYLDLQLSASAGVPLATAVVSNMAGFEPSAFIDSWGVEAITGGYRFRNDTSNDLFHAVAFGGVLSFDLAFAGEPDPLTSYVSRFVVSAFDESLALLGNNDPVTGALAEFRWTPALAAGGEGSIGIAIADPAAVSAVPEPAALLLFGAGLAAMALSLRRRSRQGQK